MYTFPIAPTRIDHVFTAYADNLAAQGKTAGQARFALDMLGDTVFTSHMGAESMRTLHGGGKTGLDVFREAVGDADVFYRPDDSWAGREVADTKIDFILTALEHDWPEF